MSSSAAAVKLRKVARRPYGAYLDVRYGRTGMPTSINNEAFRLSPKCRGMLWKFAKHRATREWEPEIWQLLDEEVRPRDLVADVGANIGLFAVKFARAATEGCVFAFEPDPSNVEDLRFHVRANGVEDRVRIVEAAVGETEGEITFAMRLGGRSSPSGIHEERWEDGPTRSVPQVRLSDAVERIDVLKIDVEGYEGQVLDGAAELLEDPARRPRFILVEVHPDNLVRAGWDTDKLESFLTERGYQIKPIVQTYPKQLFWCARASV